MSFILRGPEYRFAGAGFRGVAFVEPAAERGHTAVKAFEQWLSKADLGAEE